MGKSAQVVDRKGVANLRCMQRVPNYMKTKGIEDIEETADGTDFADWRARGGEQGAPAASEDGGEKSFRIITRN